MPNAWQHRIPATQAGDAISRWRTTRSATLEIAQGNLAGALKSYSDGLAIAEDLGKANPSDALSQRDLSISYDRIGDVEVAQGDPSSALKSLPREPRDPRAVGGPCRRRPKGATSRFRGARSARCRGRRAIGGGARAVLREGR